MELIRIPSTANQSLKCWNAADEYLINNGENISFKGKEVLILGDRFGYLTKQVLLKEGIPKVYIDLKSQEEAIKINCGEIFTFKTRDPIPNSEVCLINIPKSISELELFLSILSQSLDNSGTAFFGFMTKYFTPGYIRSVEAYFGDVNQTKAFKKSRLIIAKSINDKKKVLREIRLPFKQDQRLTQLQGVFSEKNIDYATQYLLSHLEVKDSEYDILDLGSGNGVIAHHIQSVYEHKKLTLLDNSYRAHLSGKLNISDPNVAHTWSHDLSAYDDESFDLIVTNPPFHFNFEIDLSIPFNLLRKSAAKLRSGGRLIVVANKHINYKSAIIDHFNDLQIITENNKFYILEAIK